MRSKFNFKLTLAAVSLFISLILLVLGNKTKVCLFLGLFLLGVTLIFFAHTRVQDMKLVERKTEEEIDEEENVDVDVLNETYKELSRLRRTKIKTRIVFYTAGALLIIFSFFAFI